MMVTSSFFQTITAPPSTPLERRCISQVMTKFRSSTETLYEWQKKYIEEIKNVTEAMDQNARVTEVTTTQLERTNDVLEVNIKETMGEYTKYSKKLYRNIEQSINY